MKRIFVVLFCFFVGLSGVLADNVSISVITCSPGVEEQMAWFEAQFERVAGM